MSTSDLVLLLSVLLPPLISIMAAAFRPLQAYLNAKLQASLPAEKRALAEQMAANVVTAVQQQFDGLDGSAKKKLAMDKLSALVRSQVKGATKLSDADLDVMIETAVASLKAAQGQPPNGVA